MTYGAPHQKFHFHGMPNCKQFAANLGSQPFVSTSIL
uniref:Uncharacterized protein n=1 Tax=Rhizophora mucronata TaxID=61149 RepID=A0A2P2J421_RHIMU